VARSGVATFGTTRPPAAICWSECQEVKITEGEDHWYYCNLLKRLLLGVDTKTIRATQANEPGFGKSSTAYLEGPVTKCPSDASKTKWSQPVRNQMVAYPGDFAEALGHWRPFRTIYKNRHPAAEVKTLQE
jgi:hypothetical protein